MFFLNLEGFPFAVIGTNRAFPAVGVDVLVELVISNNDDDTDIRSSTIRLI